jgi:hypothetical protein
MYRWKGLVVRKKGQAAFKGSGSRRKLFKALRRLISGDQYHIMPVKRHQSGSTCAAEIGIMANGRDGIRMITVQIDRGVKGLRPRDVVV